MLSSLKKPLAIQKKTIQGVSMKSDGQEHTSANHRRHSITQSRMNLPSWQKAKVQIKTKSAKKNYFVSNT